MKNFNFLFALLYGWFLMFSSVIWCQNIEKYNIEPIERAVKNDLKTSGAPGAMIAYVQDGRIEYQQPFGVSNKKTKVPINSKTLFLTASVTKIVVTAALLIACEQHDIDVNTPIGNILENLSPEMSTITIHEILSMSSGIIDYLPTKKSYREDTMAYFEHYGDRLVSNELRGVFSYTNIGHVLAGSLLAEIMESTFFEAIQQLVFDPIKMKYSTFYESVAQSTGYSAGHRKGSRIKHELTYSFIKPAASMFSNVNDLSRFAICFMNDGVIDKQQVMSKSVIKKMSANYTPLGVLHQYLGYPNSNYNYGMISFDFKGISFVGHPGESGSQNILFVMAPKYNATFILMSNTGFYPFINTFEKMVETFLPVQNIAIKSDQTEIEIKKYVGKYYKPNIQGNKNELTQIKSSGKKLFIEYGEDNNYPLIPSGKHKFTYSGPNTKFPMEIIFYLNESGEVEYLNDFWKTSIRNE